MEIQVRWKINVDKIGLNTEGNSVIDNINNDPRELSQIPKLAQYAEATIKQFVLENFEDIYNNMRLNNSEEPTDEYQPGSSYIRLKISQESYIRIYVDLGDVDGEYSYKFWSVLESLF